MAQLWKGRFKKELAKETNDFNSSITFDSRMYEQDIKGSIAHATMLGASGIIDKSESEKIVDGLEEILSDIKAGKLEIDMTAEDIHTFIEGELTARLGQTGKRLHTARSRNDQVALDIRLTLRDEADEVIKKLKKLVGVLCDKAEEHCDTIMPGYTHLQRAQPITFGHHLMAYASMLLRDIGRIEDAKKRMNICPLGSGAERTYCIEALMHDGKALQAGTSHYFGDGFAKAFDIQFSDKNNKLQYPHQTSWGVTTRLIGAIIMTHGDDNGLVLPPAVAPIQAIIVPVAQHKDGVLDAANDLCDRLKKVCRAKIDDSENSPGWKFAEYEMKGVPVRIEIGPRDIENGQCVMVTRHNREKTIVHLDKVESVILEKLEEVRNGIYEKALENRERKTYVAHNLDEITADLEKNGDGFIKAMWCGDEACEEKVKEITGVGSRCIPLEQEHLDDKCVCCGKPAKCMVYWGKAY